jgi:hypothetical protein
MVNDPSRVKEAGVEVFEPIMYANLGYSLRITGKGRVKTIKAKVDLTTDELELIDYEAEGEFEFYTLHIQKVQKGKVVDEAEFVVGVEHINRRQAYEFISRFKISWEHLEDALEDGYQRSASKWKSFPDYEEWDLEKRAVLGRYIYKTNGAARASKFSYKKSLKIITDNLQLRFKHDLKRRLEARGTDLAL